MEALAIKEPMNAPHLYVLQTVAAAKSEDEKEEYLDYIQQKLDNAANEFWDSQNLDNAKMKELMYGHLRASKK